VSVVILSYNRLAALEKTIGELLKDPALKGAEIIVADNGSGDGTPEKIRRKFRDARVIDMGENRGVAGFNAGVARATGDVVLILDDDAWPAEGAVERALDLLATRRDIAAVALHPKHPGTGASEWGFVGMSDVGCGMSDVKSESAAGEPAHPTSDIRHPTSKWPFMGSGNLVRREAWERVGGYEEGFFLYRNDVDLALKLLGAGGGVWFDPAWVVWHDSPAAASKSLRWFELATRNWVWLCRRHGRGRWKWVGVLSGWAWAHRLAGRSARAQWKVFWGAVDGLWYRPPPVPGACVRDGAAFESMMRIRLGRPARPRPAT
jgi:GT2 family glycosyltransferase